MRRRIGVVAVRENARLKRERLAIILSLDGGAAAAGMRAATYGSFHARPNRTGPTSPGSGHRRLI